MARLSAGGPGKNGLSTVEWQIVTDRKRLVSVVIGTKDRPETLRLALESIRALEGPDLTFEILIGDNGSAPETRAVAEEFGAVYGVTTVYGCPAARNVAMAKVSGEFVAFLDDDDVWLPGHIRPHIALLDANPDIDAVFSQYIFTDPDLNPVAAPFPPVSRAEDGDFFPAMLAGYFPQVGSTVARGTAVEKYGLMDPSLIGDSDWDWQLRIAKARKVAFLPVPAILFRSRPKGSSDKLQLTRFLFTTRIFMRHALPNWRRFRSPLHIVKAYSRSIEYYYEYFCEAADLRVDKGDRFGAVNALGRALMISPARALRDLFRTSQFRRSIARTVGLR